MDHPSSRINGDVPLLEAETAASAVPSDGTIAVSGFGSVGYPKSTPLALAEDNRDLDLTVVSGGSVGDEIDTTLVESGAVARRYPHQSRDSARAAINNGEIFYHDRHISQVGDETINGHFGEIDVAIVEAISVGEDWFIPSTSIGSVPSFVASAKKLIIELNEVQPLELANIHDAYRLGSPPHRDPIPLTEPDGRIGSSRISFAPEKLIGVIRTNSRDDPFSFRSPTAEYETIASNLQGFLINEFERNSHLDEAVYFQFGVGNLGNALMGAFASLPFGDRDVGYFGEVIQDGLLDMLDSGTFSFASATSLALSEDGQNRFFDRFSEYADNVVLRPATLSNSPELIARFGVIAINSALEVDVCGNVNSTHIGGSQVVSGIGGSGDYNRNAPIAITALPSVTNDESISRIVPMVPHVDHTEHDIDVVVTEQGVADLRGLTPPEIAEELIDCCAHPKFQPELRDYLHSAHKNGGHTPVDLSQAVSWYQ